MGVTAPRWVWVVWGLVGVAVLASTWPFWLTVAVLAYGVMAASISLVPEAVLVYAVVIGVLLWAVVALWRR